MKNLNSGDSPSYATVASDKLQLENEVINRALKILSHRMDTADVLSNPSMVRDFLTLQCAEYQSEVFGVVHLDSKHRPIHTGVLFNGTIDDAAIYPREVVKSVLKYNSAAVIFYHNHPSGVSCPSLSDKSITNRLKGALALIDVRVLDHFIIGLDGGYSFAENGLI